MGQLIHRDLAPVSPALAPVFLFFQQAVKLCRCLRPLFHQSLPAAFPSPGGCLRLFSPSLPDPDHPETGPKGGQDRQDHTRDHSLRKLQ